MKSLIIILISFLSIAIHAASFSVNLAGKQGQQTITTIASVPCTVTCNVDPEYYGRCGVVGGNDTASNATWHITDPSFVGAVVWAFNGYNSWQTDGPTVTVNITYLTPDPENPDPENPSIQDPNNSTDPSDLPFALESSLQSLISRFSTFGNTWAQWAQSHSGKVDTANQRLSGISNQLTAINSQQINNQQTFASYMDSLFNSYLNPLKDKSDTANGHLNDLKGKADTANGHLNDFNDKADTANGHLTGLNQKAEITNQNVSDTRQFTEQIKNSLQPQDVSGPSMETPLDDITPNTSSITTLKNKLLPRYSFFSNPGGSQFPEWSFTLPLQSLGWRAFTIVFGGAAWSSVGGGILLTLMQFIRTLSKFVFYYIFLRCIILYLRQW